MLIGSRQRLNTLSRLLHLTLGGVSVDQVSTAKSLGVFIDENLSWNTHIEYLRNKISTVIGALKRVRSFVSAENSIGSFNNDDGNGNENVIVKCELALL